jgi:hypothetical protein
MTPIHLLLDPTATIALEQLAEHIAITRKADLPRPFAQELINFTNNFSQQLLNDTEAKKYPELQVLGFWLRSSSVEKIKRSLEDKLDTIIVPQGLVFHIPPANVDTVFAYSLFISLLCGNTNIVRLPTKRGPAMLLLMRLLNQSLQSNDTSRNRLLLINYDHDARITELISRASDMRVIWGSDKTVEAIRQIPLAHHGRELIFPDRFSWSALDVSKYQKLSDNDRDLLAEQYFNDLFWFDQAGCASPRVLIWCGKNVQDLCEDFYKRLATTADKKQWKLETGSNIAKQTRNYEAMVDLALTQKRDYGPSLTVFTLPNLLAINVLRQNPCFGGTLFECFVDSLADIIPTIERRDQTLTYFGFDKTELEKFVHHFNGKGFDRIVPVGQALSFDTIWDGYDLPEQFTRRVKIIGDS